MPSAPASPRLSTSSTWWTSCLPSTRGPQVMGAGGVAVLGVRRRRVSWIGALLLEAWPEATITPSRYQGSTGAVPDEPPRTTQIRRHQRFAGPGHPSRDAGTGTAGGYVAKVRRRHTRLGVLEIIAITMGVVAAVYTGWVIQDVRTARQETDRSDSTPPLATCEIGPGGSAGGAHEPSTPGPLPCSRISSPHDRGDRRLDRRRLGIVGGPRG